MIGINSAKKHERIMDLINEYFHKLCIDNIYNTESGTFARLCIYLVFWEQICKHLRNTIQHFFI